MQRIIQFFSLMLRGNSSMWMRSLVKQTDPSMHRARKIHAAFFRDDVALLWT